MPTPVVAGDWYRVLFYCNELDQLSISRLDLRVINSVGGGYDLEDLLRDLTAVVAPALKACMTSQAVYDGSSAQKRNVPPFPSPITNSDLAGAGGGGANPLPRQVTGIFTKKSGIAGRKFRGRCYVPFPSTDDLTPTADTPTAGYQARVFTLSASWSGQYTIATAGVGWIVQAGLITPHGFVDVISTVAHRKWATQRRRGDYGRPNDVPDL